MHTNNYKFISKLCLLSVLISPWHVFANSLDEITEQDFLIEIPQITSATHQKQKLTEAPAAITIIDQQMIEAAGVIHITDIFKLVPGMQSYSVSANKHAVSYHDMSDDFPKRLEVMINGHSIYVPLLSTVVWESIGITIEDIDYIEVVRGSNVPTHGSNAFLGAINIITKSSAYNSGTQLTTTAGSLTTRNYQLQHSGAINSVNYKLSTGRTRNAGIDLYKDAGQTEFINFSGSYTPTLSDLIEFDLNYNHGLAYRGNGDRADPVEANFIPRDHSSNRQHIRWNRILTDHSELQVNFSRTYLHLDSDDYTAQQIDQLIGPGTGELLLTLNNGIAPQDSERGKLEVHDLEVLQLNRLTDQIDTAIGLGYRDEKAQSLVLLQSNDASWVDEQRWRLYGNINYEATPSWLINFGSMLERSSVVGNKVSSRAAINYLPDEFSSIRIAYSEAYRMPSLLELYGDNTINFGPYGIDVIARPNLHLDAERIKSSEIGYFIQDSNTDSQFDLRLFHEEITGGIGSFYIEDVENVYDTYDDFFRISKNHQNWTNKGAEIQLKLSSQDAQSFALFNYSYNSASGQRDRGYGRGVDILDKRAPKHLASALLATKPTPHTLLSLTQHYMSHTEWIEGYNGSGDRTDFTRTDIKASTSFDLDRDTTLEVALVVQNLFDREYGEFYRYNVFERRAYLQFKLGLGQ